MSLFNRLKNIVRSNINYKEEVFEGNPDIDINSYEDVYFEDSKDIPDEQNSQERKYYKILKPEGRIEFKTDNADLFAFAVEELKDEPWEVIGITKDLHNDEAMNAGNVMTEYEEKFSAMGNPIYKYIIERKGALDS